MFQKVCCTNRVITGVDSRHKMHYILIALFIVVIMMVLSSAAQAAPVTIVVDGDGSGGTCSLADAIKAANTNSPQGNCPGGSTSTNTVDTIELKVNVSLTSALPQIASDMVIDGKGHEVIGNGSFRIFYVGDDIKVGLTNMTISGGKADEGAGVFIGKNSDVNIEQCEIYKNESTNIGGGVMINGDSTVLILASNIHDNTADKDGGGIYATYAKSVTLDKDSRVLTNTASTGSGGGIYAQYTSLTIDNNAVIEENSAKINGGGIALVKSEMSMNQSSVSGNSAETGGGIYAIDTKGKNIKITESTVNKNEATRYDGGGVYAEGVVLTIEKSTIDSNNAKRSGGGITVMDADLILSGSEVTSNSANDGGGVYIQAEGKKISLTDSSISKNEATSEGGGVFIGKETEVTMDSCKIYDNTADATGGGAMIHGDSFVTFLGCSVMGNQAKNGGGGFYAYLATIRVDKNANIEKNVADGSIGGGIALVESDMKMRDSSVKGNSAETGGGIYTQDPNGKKSLAMVGSSISENTATSDGGGIYAEGIDVLVEESEIVSNVSKGGVGGGISAIQAANSGSLDLQESTVAKNQAEKIGGGILVANIGVDIDKCTIDTNSANDGGGIYFVEVKDMALSISTISGNKATDTGGGIRLQSTTGKVTDSTIFNNTISQGDGQAIYLGNKSKLEIANSIVAHGSTSLLSTQAPQASLAANDCDWESDSSLASSGYNLESGTSCGFTSTDDIQNKDPLLGPLQDNGGPTYTHFPRKKSPIIDNGKASSTTDQRGLARPKDLDNAYYPNGGGDASDIGAVEAQDQSNAVTLKNMQSHTDASPWIALLAIALVVLSGLLVLGRRKGFVI